MNKPSIITQTILPKINFKGLDIELKREIFKQSFYEFFKFCFRELFQNEIYREAPHLKLLCDRLQYETMRIVHKKQKEKDININIPPRSTKTLIVSVSWNAWTWIHDPTIPFICASFDDDLTLMNASYTKDIINSETYKLLFGHLFYIRRDYDSKGLFMNNHGGFRLSKTTGSNITGHKGTIIVTDDLQNPMTAESEVMRKKVIDYYTKSLYNRLTPADIGVRVNIQQRLHENDLTGYLLENFKELYDLICLPAEITADIHPTNLIEIYKDGLLDPIRLNRTTLSSFKKILGSRGYAGQYLQSPFANEGNIIKREWLEIVTAELLTRNPETSPIQFFIDSAYTEKTENDPSAILACYFQDNQMYIIGVEEVWLKFPDLCRFIVQYVNNFDYTYNSKIYVEPKASGKSIVQSMIEETNLNIVEGKTPKDDKTTRVYAQTPRLESKRVKIVKGHWNEKFINQCLAFPNSLHDDMVDVLTASMAQLFDDTFDFGFIG